VGFDPYAPHGPVVESTIRVVTWNVWGRAIGLYPDRRFDYIFSAWPRRGGVGHPTHCSLLGVRAPGEQQVSDHYGLAADLRY
jgi:endonuclease/exonuclease/phosphatase family metal-dependent hydrolase